MPLLKAANAAGHLATFPWRLIDHIGNHKKRFLAFAEINIIIMILFWSVYYKILLNEYKKDPNQPIFSSIGGNPKDNKFNLFYYTVVVHTTLGFGDINPLTKGARLATILHVLCSFSANLIIFI